MRIEEILLHLDLDDINQLFLICFSLKLFTNDYNGDGVIDDNDKVPMKLTSDPAYTYSFTLGFNYKNFGFRALFYGVAGVEKRTSFLWEFPYDYDMAWPESLERWHWNNVDANRPRLSMKNTAHIRQSSTYGLMDASYFRFLSV